MKNWVINKILMSKLVTKPNEAILTQNYVN